MVTSEQTQGRVVWEPPSAPPPDSTFERFLSHLGTTRGLTFPDYRSLHEWSVTELADFWTSVWEFFDVRSATPHGPAVTDLAMPGTVWFPGATVNYAEHALRHRGDRVAVVEHSQTRERRELGRDELRAEVGRFRAALAGAGVGRGDRVATYCPTIVEALVVYLATVSLGAVYSSCPVEFGVDGVVSRLGQIRPTVLVGVDGYRYGARAISRVDELDAIRTRVPSIGTVVLVPYLDPAAEMPGAVRWGDFVAGHDAPPAFDPVPFDHPLVIVYSSGTTGPPKPIVHCHGGVLVEHLKSLGLQFSMGPEDRFFWHTTTGWMMWNYLVAGLLVGAGIVLFDGDPGSPDHGVLWRMAADERVSVFGTSPRFLLMNRRAGLRPRDVADLSRMRIFGSTGSTLDTEAYGWFTDAVGPDIALVSGSGGTDVLSGLVGGAPNVPVYAGELSCAALGVDVAVLDGGVPVVGREGELVVRRPMPSMPVGFWGDDDGSRLREAYFDANPGVWTHGDWATHTGRGTFVISGRSDATLNRSGVRIGTAELYSVVDDTPGVRDSLAIGLEATAGHDDLLVLFVVPESGTEIDDELSAELVRRIRGRLSPRHVPDRILPLDAIPRTTSGKKAEVPVKRMLKGAAPLPADGGSVSVSVATAASLDALRAELLRAGKGEA